MALEDGDNYTSELNISENIDDEPPAQYDVINDCDDFTYYSVVFGFLAAIVAAAFVINDLSLIFGLIAAFSESMLNFILPGLFFLNGLMYLGVDSPPKKMAASLFVFLGLAYFVYSNYFNLVKITNTNNWFE